MEFICLMYHVYETINIETCHQTRSCILILYHCNVFYNNYIHPILPPASWFYRWLLLETFLHQNFSMQCFFPLPGSINNSNNNHHHHDSPLCHIQLYKCLRVLSKHSFLGLCFINLFRFPVFQHILYNVFCSGI